MTKFIPCSFKKSVLALGLILASVLISASAHAAGFSTQGSMVQPRDQFTATLLPSGQVLAVGGQSTDGAILQSAEIYNPTLNTWTLVAPPINARYQHIGVLLPTGKVLVAGGFIPAPVQANANIAEIYDPVTNRWTAARSLNSARAGATATVLQSGKVLVVGGFNAAGQNPATAEVYDPVANTWTNTGNLSVPRNSHAATLLPNGNVLVSGGNPNGSLTASCELYNPGTNSWSTTGSMLNARRQHISMLLPNGKVLVQGDSTGTPMSELYNPAAGTWAATTGAPSVNRDNGSAALLPNGTVLLAGGNEGQLNACELYNPTSSTWSSAGNTVAAREDSCLVVLSNGKVLIVGGFGGLLALPLNSVEQYDSSTVSASATTNASSVRTGHTATLLPNGNVFVASGQNGGLGYNSNYDLFSSASNSFTNNAVLVHNYFLGTATLLPTGKVLLAGGQGNNPGNGSAQTSTELYNPTANTSAAATSMNTARSNHAAVLLPTGKALVIGGKNVNSNSIASTEIYDPASGAWNFGASLSNGRSSHTATLLSNGLVLVAGGEPVDNGGPPPTAAELYNPFANTWSSASSINTARYFHTATLLPNGKVLIAGGIGASGLPLQSAELYDPATNSWTVAGMMTTSRALHTATLLPNGKVLLAGGFGGSSIVALNSTELYDFPSNSFTASSSLSQARYYHTATLLNTGNVLFVGGQTVALLGAISTAELYSTSLGFVPGSPSQPTIASITNPLVNGTPAVLTGTQFRGVSESSSGGNISVSPTNYPLVQLQSLVNGQSVFLAPNPATPFTSTTYTSLGVPALPVGYATATVIVNGIPSVASVILISKATTTTAIGTISPGSSVVGQTVTIPFTVVPNPSNAPLGNVTISDNDGLPIVTVPANVGTATLAFPTAGSRTLTVSYPGDQNTFPSSASTTYNVTPANTTVTIGTLVQVSTLTYTIPFSVTVNSPGAGAPAITTALTGAVVVGEGVANTTVDVSTGTATVTFPVAGDHTISVSYSGDGNFNSSSATTPLSIPKLATTTSSVSATVIRNPNAQTVSLPATVTPVGGTGSVNEGTVTFEITDSDNNLVGTATTSSVVVNGNVSVDYPLPAALDVGTYQITATYSGSGNYLSSSDTTRLLTVTRGGNLIPAISNVSVSRNPARTGVPVTITAEGVSNVQPLSYIFSSVVNNAVVTPPLMVVTPAAGQPGSFTTTVDTAGD